MLYPCFLLDFVSSYERPISHHLSWPLEREMHLEYRIKVWVRLRIYAVNGRERESEREKKSLWRLLVAAAGSTAVAGLLDEVEKFDLLQRLQKKPKEEKKKKIILDRGGTHRLLKETTSVFSFSFFNCLLFIQMLTRREIIFDLVKRRWNVKLIKEATIRLPLFLAIRRTKILRLSYNWSTDLKAFKIYKTPSDTRKRD